MMGRVQLMREAVESTLTDGGLDGKPLAGAMFGLSDDVVSDGMAWAVVNIGDAYATLDPRFYTDLDNGDRPSALIVANARGSQYVPLAWTEKALIFNRQEYGLPSVVVPLGADDAWRRVVEAMEKVITDFYDRHQPTAEVAS